MESITPNENNMMTALFSDRDVTETAFQDLLDRGFTRDQISVVMSEETRNSFYGKATTSEIGNKAAEGTGVGAAIGGTAGAIIAAIVAIGTTVVIPGLNLVILGPIAAALAGAGVGGAAGGLIGALVGLGIPEETVKHYESGLKEGGFVLGVEPHSAVEANEIEKVWKGNNAERIYR
ncbi:MAG: hypothetical protein ACRD6X_01165 [Pyrinomonadaceae bacterium]